MSSATRDPSIGTNGGGLDFFFFLLVVFFKSAHGSLKGEAAPKVRPGSGFGRFTGAFWQTFGATTRSSHYLPARRKGAEGLESLSEGETWTAPTSTFCRDFWSGG